ncbi:hypothetical protein WH47_08500, partial [Habropoda laboriosa]
TDQGRQFESTLFKQLSLLIGTKHLRTTAYHPAANGMVERFHRQMKSAIACHADSWAAALPVVLLGIRAASKDDIKATSAEMVYGEPIRLPGELLTNQRAVSVSDETFVANLRQHFRGLRPAPITRHGNKTIFIFKDLNTTTHVFVRHGVPKGALQPAFDSPYEVVERHSKHFNIRVKDRVVPVSLDRLKPAYLKKNRLRTRDPYRGRPTTMRTIRVITRARGPNVERNRVGAFVSPIATLRAGDANL